MRSYKIYSEALVHRIGSRLRGVASGVAGVALGTGYQAGSTAGKAVGVINRLKQVLTDVQNDINKLGIKNYPIVRQLLDDTDQLIQKYSDQTVLRQLVSSLGQGQPAQTGQQTQTGQSPPAGQQGQASSPSGAGKTRSQRTSSAMPPQGQASMSQHTYTTASSSTSSSDSSRSSKTTRSSRKSPSFF